MELENVQTQLTKPMTYRLIHIQDETLDRRSIVSTTFRTDTHAIPLLPLFVY